MAPERTVQSLGAWCDLDSSDEYTGSSGGTSFKVREFALLSDGREVTLSDDRGWTTSWTLGGTPGEQREQLSVEEVERDIYNVVLPDNAEETVRSMSGSSSLNACAKLGLQLLRTNFKRCRTASS